MALLVFMEWKKAMAGELVEFDDEDKTVGMVLNLAEDHVGVVLLGEGRKIAEGMEVKTTGRIASTPVGEKLLGRVVDPLVTLLMAKGAISSTEFSSIEIKAPGIVARTIRL